MNTKLTIQERVHVIIYKFVNKLLQAIPDELGHVARVWWTYAAPDIVRCDRCGLKYRQAFIGSTYYTQGRNCAAETFQWKDVWVVQCYYGSGFDTNVYKFVNEPEVELRNLRTICDSCIQALLERKIIELVKPDMLFELVNK